MDGQWDWDTVVIGAGAAGLIAAERSAATGRRTLLVEKNTKPGVKILMSGGTRCNVTQHTDARGIVQAFGRQGRFLHSPLSYLDPAGVVELFEASGVPTKVESTGKVFPVSDRALHVRDALVNRLQAAGATLKLGTAVLDVHPLNDGGFRVALPDTSCSAKRVIVTVGGQSYPGCGTTGDGYRWLARLGHTLVTPVPALVPLTTKDAWLHELAGVSFEQVRVALEPQGGWDAGSKRERAEMVSETDLLLTHFGLSGPAAMNVSRGVTRYPERTWNVRVDLFPQLPLLKLLDQMKQAAGDEPRRQLGTLLARWVVQRFALACLEHLGFDAQRRVAEVPGKWWTGIGELWKGLKVEATGTQGFPKAEVTAGGVALDEVDSRTMQSKRWPGLFLAGEILDLDGPIGGYNFQAAFSTGWVAGYQAQHLTPWPA